MRGKLGFVLAMVVSLLLLASCFGPSSSIPDLSVDSVSPGSGPSDGGTLVTVTGAGFYEGEVEAITGPMVVTVCGAPLVDVVVQGEPQTTVLPGGATASIIVGDVLTGTTGPASDVDATDVVVTRPDGENVTLEDAFSCFAPAPEIASFTATPASIGTDGVVTFAWVATSPGLETLTCTVDPGDGSDAIVVADCHDEANRTATHAYDASGSFVATLVVTDESGDTAEATASVAVSNAAPSFTSSPVTSAEEDQTYVYSVTATDPDGGDVLTLTAPVLPSWLAFTDAGDGTGILTGTPGSADVGVHDVTLRVSDGTTMVDQSFTITVASAPLPPPTATDDGPSDGSAPGDPYHAAYSTSASPQSFGLPAPGVLDNDDDQQATVVSFGAGSLGGDVTTYAAGATVSPLPGAASGSLQVNADGSVAFQPSDGFTGVFSFQYRIANGTGSSDAGIAIAVGVRPTAADSTYPQTLIGNVGIDTSVGSGFAVSAGGDGIAFGVASTTHGQASVAADGTFAFDPAAGVTSTDGTLVFSVTNGFGSVSGTVTIPIGAERIWFVDSGAAAGGDGRLSTPFSALVDVQTAANGNGDRIFLFSGSGPYGGGIALLAGQRLLGQGAKQTLATIAGVAPPTDSVLPSTGGTPPSIVNDAGWGVQLWSNNRLQGFTVGNTSSGGVFGSSFGTLTVEDVTINGMGQALWLDSGTIAGSGFTSVSSYSGLYGVYLRDIQGTLHLGSGFLYDSVSQSFYVDGGSGIITYGGEIDSDWDRIVEIRNKTGGGVTLSYGSLRNVAVGSRGILITGNSGGTYTFKNSILAVDTGSLPAVTLSDNAGASIAFDVLLMDVSTTSGTAFTATGGGTVTVSGVGPVNVTTTTGTAVEIVDTTIGAGGVKWHSVNVAGGGSAPAIHLENTGSGAFSVTGSGVAASGGTIRNIQSDAVRLIDVGGSVSLANMVIEDIGDINVEDSEHDAIHGANVQGGLVLTGMTIRRISDMAIHGAAFPSGDGATVWNGLTITNSTIVDTNRYHVAGIGDTSDEGSVRILGLRGTSSITGSTFQNGAEHLDLFATAGTLDLTVQNSQFLDSYREFASGAIASVGKMCLDLTVQNAANATASIAGSTFRNCRIGSVRIANDTGATGTITATASNNTFVVTDHSSGSGGDFDFPMGGVKYATRGAASARFDGRINGNTFTDVTNADGGVGNVTLDMGQGVVQVLVDGNMFHAPGNAAWFARADATSSFRLLFDGNTYQRDAFPCTTDPSCGGGYFGPGLFNRTQIQNGGVMDVTYFNEDYAQHDTTFDPGNSVEIQVRNVGGGGTVCARLYDNSAPEGYGLIEEAGTLKLELGVSSIVVPRTCSSANPNNCTTVLADNINTGGGGNPAAFPPTTTVVGTVDIVPETCARPVGSIF